MRSGLTIRGRCLLAAGVAAAVCAVVLGERDLLRVAAFVVGLPLLAAVFSGQTRFGLTARRELVPSRVPVGSESSVELHLTGRGRLPGTGLVVEDVVPHALGGRTRFTLGNAPGRRGILLRYSVQPSLRGVHQVGPLRLHASDPFGLSEFERELGHRSRLVAVPQVVSLSGLPTGSGLGVNEDGSTRMRAGHGDDDVMVRQYRQGDDMRRVHWKSTAHRDELMVRAEERPWYGGVTVLLDSRAAAHRGSGARSSVEYAISATASICLHLRQHGQQVNLVTAEGDVLAGGAGKADGAHDDETVLDALAALRPSLTRDLVCDSDPGSGRELIAVLGATTARAVDELTRARPQGIRSLALVLDVRAWNSEATDGGFDPRVTARRLRAAGWTVAVVDGPRSSMATAWAELCGQKATVYGTGVPG
jgi:uncharacterized protein (DUF58 family)